MSNAERLVDLMKRKISLFVCVLLSAIVIMAVGASAAETYTPDDYGQYTVTLSQQAHNSYMLLIFKYKFLGLSSLQISCLMSQLIY